MEDTIEDNDDDAVTGAVAADERLLLEGAPENGAADTKLGV